MKASLDSSASNQAIVTIGNAELFFSYRSLIAVRAMAGHDYLKAFNPDYRGFSPTTTKHATAMGCKGFPDAPSAEAFAEIVARALTHVAER